MLAHSTSSFEEHRSSSSTPAPWTTPSSNISNSVSSKCSEAPSRVSSNRNACSNQRKDSTRRDFDNLQTFAKLWVALYPLQQTATTHLLRQFRRSLQVLDVLDCIPVVNPALQHPSMAKPNPWFLSAGLCGWSRSKCTCHNALIHRLPMISRR